MNSNPIPFLTTVLLDRLQQANIKVMQKEFDAGQPILIFGEVSSGIYIIDEGSARVFIMQDRKVELSVLQENQFFGEMSCLTGDPISANVEAVTKLKVTILDREGLLFLMDEVHSFRMQMIESMVSRIKNSNDRVLQEHTRNVMLIKQQDEQTAEKYGDLIGESDEIKGVQSAIEKYKQEAQLMIIGEKGTEKLTVARKLHEAASKQLYPFIPTSASQLDMQVLESKVLLANEGTLIIEDANELPVNVLKELLNKVGQTTIILLVEEALPLPIQQITIPPLRERIEDFEAIAICTLQKLGAVNPELILSDEAIRILKLYPFLAGNVEELQDVLKEAFILSEGRTIFGKHIKFGRKRKPGERPKIGLALGSGSTKGIAHLGVWEQLEKAKIPIDLVAGTSIGSVIGGMMAYGMTYKEGSDIFRELSWGKLMRPTVPIKSFVHNTPMYKYMQNIVGDVKIEDLKIPFAAVASELATGDAYIMKSGILVQALCASTAIPTIIRPVEIEGKLLVDGAVVHPVPAALTRSMGADIVIAVNICKEPSTQGNVRHIFESLMNTIDIMSSKLVREELQMADIIIRPDFENKAIKFKDFDFAYNAGSKASEEMLAYIENQINIV